MLRIQTIGMLISDIFGLAAIVSMLIALLCCFNGLIFDSELLIGLVKVFVNITIICFIIFVVLSVVGYGCSLNV